MTLDQRPQADNFEDDPAYNAHPASWGNVVRPSDDTWQRRDAQAVSSHQVHFTSADDFLEEIAADHKRGWITDQIVRLSITSRPATLDELDGKRGVGGERISLYDAKHVECSYLARGQLVKLSRFCGCACESQTGPHAVERTQATALVVLEVLHQVQAALAKLDGLDVRGGGLYVEAGNWRASPDQSIASPPAVVCATCGVPIHFANNQWRDADARPDVLVDAGFSMRTNRQLKRLDHLHDPEVAGRLV